MGEAKCRVSVNMTEPFAIVVIMTYHPIMTASPNMASSEPRNSSAAE